MHPVLFTIGNLQIRSFGVLLLLAFLLAEYVIWRQGSKKGYNEEKLLDLGIICFIYAFLFARLGYFLLHLGQFEGNYVHLFFIWEGGLDFSLGLMGGLIGYYYFIRRNKWSFFEVGDFFAIAVLMAYILGRIGTYLNGEQIKGQYLPFNQTPSSLALVEVGLLIVFLFLVTYFYRNKEKLIRYYNLTFLRRRKEVKGPAESNPDPSITHLDSVTESLAAKGQSVLTVRSGGVFFLTLILLMLTRLGISTIQDVGGFSFYSNLVIIGLCLLGLFLYRSNKLVRLERVFNLAQSSVRYFRLVRKRTKKEKETYIAPISQAELAKEPSLTPKVKKKVGHFKVKK